MTASPSALSTPQLDKWAGEFGDAYTARNASSESAVRNKAKAFGQLLARMDAAPPRSILEIGCNMGTNLRALSRLTDAELYGLEPNASARERLIADGVVPREAVLAGSGDKVPFAGQVDLVFTSGVLIHVPPETFPATLDEMARLSRRWILMMEYFAPRDEALSYHGHEDLLFRRDYGHHLMSRHPGLEVVDYGFFWRHASGLDDLTWWLFRKP
jgi:spore coat polysaccharide biosynthesis protein SpsF